MKSTIKIWLIVLMLLSSGLEADAGKCYDALPDECKVDYDFVLEQAEQYADILRAKPKVTRCIVKKDHLLLRVERGSMAFEITLFDVQAHSCRVTDDGEAYAVYRDGSCWRGNIISFLGGAGIMFLLVLLL